MPGFLKVFATRFFLFLNIIAATFFLLSCLAPYLSPEKWWFISFLGLGFAIVFIVLIAFILFWLIVKPRYILISLIPMIIGWKSISTFFAVRSSEKFNYNKPKDVLRVVSWNVARFLEWRINNNKGSQTRVKMLDLLKKQNADVLCLQEFMHSAKQGYYDNLSFVIKELGYPYYYYSWDTDGELHWTGEAIFSRHPIIDGGMIRYQRPGMPQALIHADIVFNEDTIRFYTTHLQSVQFRKRDYASIEDITRKRDSILESSRNIFSKLKRGYIFRSRQTDIVKEITGNSPHPFILAGDLNDVPNSYTYFTIKGNKLQDAFLKKGFGIGRTYSFLSPTLRIDYILTTRDFSVLQFNRLVKNYSDHYMLVADVQLKK
ncbi:MAG: endonuclease/exonuclease/phosphatase family protein [Chitinophagaceae bacterium]